MSDDLISRLSEIRSEYNCFDENEEPYYRALSEAIKILSAQPEQQWIPCSERLPEKSGRYLVTNTRLGAFEVTWNIFYNGKGEAPEGWLYDDGTIAWMPLPEPYKT